MLRHGRALSADRGAFGVALSWRVLRRDLLALRGCDVVASDRVCHVAHAVSVPFQEGQRRYRRLINVGRGSLALLLPRG